MVAVSSKYSEKICVIGLGYIGLPTASLLASKGFAVHGVDINPKAVEMINQGRAHIVEPDLDLLLKASVNSGRLKAHLTPEKSDIFIIAVPTPFQDGKKPDLKFVESAVESIASFLRPGNLVLLESTSPVGTTEMIAKMIQDKRPDLSVAGSSNKEANLFVAYCPERVLPGSILKELIQNDRTVGGVCELSTKKAKDFYSQFVVGQVVTTNSRTAELVKLSENAFRDVNIAFANELSRVCNHLGIDVWETISIANRHPRVQILRPGPGVGGHCIAVDPWFIVDSAPSETKLISAARNVNDSQPHFVCKQIAYHFKELEDKNLPIVLLGLSFKPNIDDLRESPAIEVVSEVVKSFRGRVMVVEPHIEELPKYLKGNSNLELVALDRATSEAGLIAILVKHDQFKGLEMKASRHLQILDFVGLLNKYGG